MSQYILLSKIGSNIYLTSKISLTLVYVTKTVSPIGCCFDVGNDFGNISTSIMNWRFVSNYKRCWGLKINTEMKNTRLKPNKAFNLCLSASLDPHLMSAFIFFIMHYISLSAYPSLFAGDKHMS